MKREGVLVMAVVALVMVASLSLVTCGSRVASPVDTHVAKDLAVKAGVIAVSTAVESYEAEHEALPPAATRELLGPYLDPWPRNPFNGREMTQGTGVGDYAYVILPGGAGFSIAGHLSTGQDVVRP